MIMIQKQNPYKKKPAEGDFFSIMLPNDRYLMGRVVRHQPSHIPTLDDILIYIFSNIIDDIDTSMHFDKNKLLIPPTYVNRLGWSKGYFNYEGGLPLAKEDCYPNHCFCRCPFSPTGCIDQHGKFVERFEPCGNFGLGNYNTIDMQVCEALGL